MDDKQTFHSQLNTKKTNLLTNEPDVILPNLPKPNHNPIISNTIEDLSPTNSLPQNLHTMDPRFMIASSFTWPLASPSISSTFPLATPNFHHLPSIQNFYNTPMMDSHIMTNDILFQGLSKRMKIDNDEVIDLSEMSNLSDGNNNNIPNIESDSIDRKNIKFFDLTTEGQSSATSRMLSSFPNPKPTSTTTQLKHKHNDADKAEWLETFNLVKEQVNTFRIKEGKKNLPGEFKKAEFPRFLHDDKIRSWLNHQCKLQKQGSLSKEQHDMLVDIGFDFMQRRALRKNQWDEQYEKLKQLKEQHGSCEVPAHYSDKGLKVWVNDQRKNYRNGALRKNKVELLNALGFSWEAPSRIAKSSSHEMDSETSLPSNNQSEQLPTT